MKVEALVMDRWQELSAAAVEVVQHELRAKSADAPIGRCEPSIAGFGNLGLVPRVRITLTASDILDALRGD